MPRNLDKALVQGKVVSDRVLPSLFVISVERKVLQKDSVEDF